MISVPSAVLTSSALLCAGVGIDNVKLVCGMPNEYSVIHPNSEFCGGAA